MADLWGYVRNENTNTATGAHFCQPGHSLSDMKFISVEQVKKVDELYRKQREKYFIQKFNTCNIGMNRKT